MEKVSYEQVGPHIGKGSPWKKASNSLDLDNIWHFSVGQSLTSMQMRGEQRGAMVKSSRPAGQTRQGGLYLSGDSQPSETG